MGDLRTIFALSSGHGRAGVAVIRISGDAAGTVIDRMAAPRPKPRFAAFRRIRHPITGEMLDEALVLWFPGPRTETGEDMAELQVHGGAAVLRAVLGALACIDGCRLAEPGEFARRAFENGKLDLTAAEGLADLVDAETEEQRRQALQQAGGALASLYDGWRGRLIEARGLIEAAIDFSDEGDVAADALARGRQVVERLAGEIGAHLADANRGEIVRDGFRVVLAGPPNAGKSSLLNTLARRDIAIVSEEAGTTRDVIEARLDIGGYAVVVADTAGIRDAAGAIEREGIRRTEARARDADLVLWIVDGVAPDWRMPDDFGGGSARVRILNKADVADPAAAQAAPADVLVVSARTGQGLAALCERIATAVRERVGEGSGPRLSNQRQRRHLEAACAALAEFLAGPIGEAELRAEDLRLAADALGRIVGRIDVEDVLGEIFGRFCIGK